MRKPFKKLVLHKETLTEWALSPLVRGGYPLSVETRCEACPWGQTISCSIC